MTALSFPARLAALPPERRLHLALGLDAVVTGANAIVYLAAAGPLEDLLGLEAGLLRAAGALLAAYAAALWVIASRRPVARGAVTAVVLANAAWAVASVVAAVAGWGTPTTGGTVWVVLQGLVVAAFAGLQRRASR
jgi:hypothetical protein